MTWDELQHLLHAHPRTAVYVTLPGCGPCQAVRPWLEVLFDDPAWRWVVVDSSVSPEVTGQLLVFAHPTLVLFLDGREAARFSRVLRRQEVEHTKAAMAEVP
jgi:thioredoxin-like negative regulator of GroEL